MAEYKPGEMDIAEQRETYDVFWSWTVKISVFVLALLALLIIIFI